MLLFIDVNISNVFFCVSHALVILSARAPGGKGNAGLYRRDRAALPAGIAAAIGRLIASGRLAPGDRLPTVRVLAGELGVSPATVSHAWQALSAVGLITSRGRGGTFVQDTAPTWLPAGFTAALELGPAVVLLQPRAHNPTGASMTAHRAEELAQLLRTTAASADTIVIEDDHSAEISIAPDMSLGFWLPVPSERDAMVRLTASGIRVAGGSPFLANTGGPEFIRVTAGALPDDIRPVAEALFAAAHPRDAAVHPVAARWS